MSTTVIENCAIATVDGARHRVRTRLDRRHRRTHRGGQRLDDRTLVDRRHAVHRRHRLPGDTRLVNTHHHFYQWLTRGLAQDAALFEWLTTLYPIWARLDADLEHAAASAALAALALSGCTSAVDHHYVVPREGGDLFAAEIEAARRIGLRFHPTRGSMNLGTKDGGLPPDTVVQDADTILAESEEIVARHHDPSPDSMLRIGLAPCSPFTATRELMRDSAELARRLGVRLHTHCAEEEDEEEFCLARFGARPVDNLESLGFLGPDVWVAHAIYLSDADIAKLAASGTGVAHCPSSNARLGATIARVPELLAAGVPVGLGVDGVASNESGSLGAELRQALLVARARSGPKALTARGSPADWARWAARAASDGRTRLGSLEVGKLADIALWRVDGLGHGDIADPVAALVFGPPAPLEALLVGGTPVVDRQRTSYRRRHEIARECARRSATAACQRTSSGSVTVKRRTASRLALHVDRPVVLRHDLLDDREAEARTVDRAAVGARRAVVAVEDALVVVAAESRFRCRSRRSPRGRPRRDRRSARVRRPG